MTKYTSGLALALGALAALAPLGCGDDDKAATHDAAPGGSGGTGGGAGTGGGGGGAGGGGGSGGSAAGSGGSAAGSGGGGSGGAAGIGGSAGSGGAAGTGGAAGADAGAPVDAAVGGGTDAATPGGGDAGAGMANPMMSFFVTSATSRTGNLGGLAAADMTCQRLAAAVGVGNKTWRAYLSVDQGPDGKPINARDRIGKGPWYNAKGEKLADDLDKLHAMKGDYKLFITEKGAYVNGQWAGSPRPNEHDILTGTKTDGTVAMGQNCKSWTSQAAGDQKMVGHSDGLGPNMATTMHYPHWHGSHVTGCADTTPGGGAGRFYCFAAN